MNSVTDADAIATLARAGAWLRRHDHWTADRCAAALGDVAIRALPMPTVERLAMACWAHRQTESPEQVSAPGPWWSWVQEPNPQRREEPRSARRSPVNHAAIIREQLAEQARVRAQEGSS